jgi:hypothetical protein
MRTMMAAPPGVAVIAVFAMPVSVHGMANRHNATASDVDARMPLCHAPSPHLDRRQRAAEHDRADCGSQAWCAQ